MIPVTKPFLPPKAEYQRYLDGIWERNWLTNNGPLVNELELSLKEYLGLDHLLFVSNGTIALQLAIKALDLKGEIITTPFSYVATTSSIVWEGCTPVFVDILPDSLTIDPSKIEAAITPHTSAILATHVYGIPCEVEAIQEIADRYGLKVIYDGAHSFGVKVNIERKLQAGFFDNWCICHHANSTQISGFRTCGNSNSKCRVFLAGEVAGRKCFSFWCHSFDVGVASRTVGTYKMFVLFCEAFAPFVIAVAACATAFFE